MVLMVDRTRRPHRQQMIVGRTGRMRHLSNRRRILLAENGRSRWPFTVGGERRERFDPDRTEGQSCVDALRVEETPESQRRVARISRPRGTELRVALRRHDRDLEIGAEAAVVLIVVLLRDDVTVGELRLEVERVRRALAWKQRREDRSPVGAVRMDAPQAPKDPYSQALRLQRAEQNSSVYQADGVQGHAEVEVPDQLDVAAVIVHDEQLERRPWVLRGREPVSIADEHQTVVGNGNGPRLNTP